MERQEGTGGYRRDEALMAVARLSISDADFLRGMKRDPASTLWQYGFALSPQEMREAEDFLGNRRDAGDDDIREDLEREIRASAERRIWNN
ncbi:hypothetical protein GBA63_03515 [Rubrobacter tropicus]|uniref:Uncharacterized protein n=1 Tax=Rubrobacter tropicus TaxID=2653851 RepID=A0A6G8Q5S6_9ACTN|nr:hypothetical protein [Rubrobacter tropicus]QIN81810.1 hypothetical protein GBA63_03515 [Rubrobacter tropicus]